jgi:hypothetical protein
MLNNELWYAIYDLYELLIEKCNAEVRYQAYFEQHPVVFSILNLDSPYSFEKKSPHALPHDDEREFRPEPDFIARVAQSSTLSIVELKTPFVGKITTSRSDGNRLKLSAIAESNLSQSIEYALSIKEREVARDYLQRLFSIRKISDVEVLLIYGLSAENQPDKIEKLLSGRQIKTKLVFFDSLMEKLINRYQSNMQLPIGLPGITAVYHLSINKQQVNELAVISEGKSNEGGKLCLSYSSGVMSLTLTDKAKKSYILEAAVPTSQCIYLKFEFCNSLSGAFMSLNVNNERQDIKVSKTNFKFSYDEDEYEYYLVSNILEYSSQLGSYHYFKRKASKPGKIVFGGAQYLLRNATGMGQNDPLHQPKYIKSV